MPNRAPLTADYLLRRYVAETASAQQIADETGWSNQYVRDRLRDNGISLRPRGMTKPGKPGPEALQQLVGEGLSVVQIAERIGYSRSGVDKLLAGFGMTITPRRRTPLTDQPLLEELAAGYAQGRSLLALGRQHGHSADWARARLVDAGVTIAAEGRRQRVQPQLVLAALDEGLRTPEIAERLGCSDTTVRQVIRDHHLTAPPRRPRGPSRHLPPPPSPDLLRSLYVDQELAVAEIAAQVGISTTRIAAALEAAGIVRRRSGWTEGTPPAPITLEQLQQLYVRGGATVDDTAATMSTTPKRIRTALRTHGIPIRSERRPAPPPLDVGRDELHSLYVDRRLTDADIAGKFGVPTWRVTKRRRELGVYRPAALPPRPDPVQPPPPGELHRLYVDQGHTLVQIARAFHTSSPTVRSWLIDAGVQVKPRTTRQTRSRPDVDQVRELYVQRQWTSPEIAAHLGTTTAKVLRTLHEQAVPVRWRNAPDVNESRLAALYGDPEVTGLLQRHQVPPREVVGGIAERFPDPAPLTSEFLTDAYEQIGLSAEHIELLTGQPHERVLAELRAATIPVRPVTTFSPWFLRQAQLRSAPARTVRS